jgi:hypothetical protein
MAQTRKKRCTVITLSHSKQPYACSFLQQMVPRGLADFRISVWIAVDDVLDLFLRRAMFPS